MTRAKDRQLGFRRRRSASSVARARITSLAFGSRGPPPGGRRGGQCAHGGGIPTGQALRRPKRAIDHAAHRGEPLMADALATTALAAAVEHGLVGEVPGCLETRAVTALLLGRYRLAGVLMGAARRLREERELHGRYLPTNGHLAAAADRLQAALGDDDFDEALTEGAALPWPDAVAYAQRGA